MRKYVIRMQKLSKIAENIAKIIKNYRIRCPLWPLLHLLNLVKTSLGDLLHQNITGKVIIDCYMKKEPYYLKKLSKLS